MNETMVKGMRAVHEANGGKGYVFVRKVPTGYEVSYRRVVKGVTKTLEGAAELGRLLVEKEVA